MIQKINYEIEDEKQIDLTNLKSKLNIGGPDRGQSMITRIEDIRNNFINNIIDADSDVGGGDGYSTPPPVVKRKNDEPPKLIRK